MSTDESIEGFEGASGRRNAEFVRQREIKESRTTLREALSTGNGTLKTLNRYFRQRSSTNVKISETVKFATAGPRGAERNLTGDIFS